jgi:hypothetical protein
MICKDSSFYYFCTYYCAKILMAGPLKTYKRWKDAYDLLHLGPAIVA